jgi:hypothetical protein
MGEKFENLSGQWLGRYEYEHGQPPVAFEADVTDDAGALSGQTGEQNTFRPGLGPVLTAIISGTRTAHDVAFSKQYQGFEQGDRLAYQGTANAALTRIEGRWRFVGTPWFAGRFVMMRKPKAAARAARKAEVERVLAFTEP